MTSTRTPQSISDQSQAGWAPRRGLYLHIPFCPYKCPYCDFATHVGGDARVEPYVRALCREIEQSTGDDSRPLLETVYFGGGTPGMLPADRLEVILATVGRVFSLAPDAEISLEANPGEISFASLEAFRRLGINRISFGAQSLQNAELQALGRGHQAADVAASVLEARGAGFDQVSLDLMYGIPDQTMASWEATLETVIKLRVDHVSLYSLIVEPGTPFERRRARGNLPLPEDDMVADLYDRACEVMASAGFEHYEVANWAQPGCRCRHNLAYWHDEQFWAAGVGAYDYLRPFRSVRLRHTARYIKAVLEGRDPVVTRDLVGPLDERFETVVMRLRLLDEGIDPAVYEARFQETLAERYGPVVRELEAQGFLEWVGSRLRLREAMVPLANEAWERFLPEPAGSRRHVGALEA